MLKHLLILFVLSIVVILFLHELTVFLEFLGYCHLWFADKLTLLFSHSVIGLLISHVIALVLIPLIIALIPAFIYWLIRRSEMPHVILVAWIVWIMLITIIALH